MRNHELIDRLLKLPPDIEVELEVGGDGAIHIGSPVAVEMRDGQSVTISSERSWDG